MKRLFILMSLLLTGLLSAQDGSAIDIKFLNNNNISMLAGNYGSIGYPNCRSNIEDFVWKGLGYMFEFGTIIGGEVITNSGDTLHICSDSHVIPTQGDYDPSAVIKWGWLPLSDSSNFIITPRYDSLGISRSSYHICDYTNTEFAARYKPSSADTTILGLGLKAKVSIYQPKGFASNAVVLKYDVTNSGTTDYNKLFLGFFGDPHIGGSADYADDRVKFIRRTDISNSLYQDAANTILLLDDDARGIGGQVPGQMGFKMLSNDNLHEISYFTAAPYGSAYPKNDELMWEWMTKGINTDDDIYKTAGDNVISFGAGPFSLSQGETKSFSIAICVEATETEILRTMHLLNHAVNWYDLKTNPGARGGKTAYTITLVNAPSKISDGTILSWKYSGSDPDARISIEYSVDYGESWNPVKSAMTLSDNCYWNTSNLPDGQYYLLRIISYNPDNLKDYYYSITDNYITIDKPSENASPELYLLSDLKDKSIESNTGIQYITGDADNSTLTIKGEYGFSESGPFSLLFSEKSQAGKNSYSIDPSKIACSEKAYLKITADDGNSQLSRITGPFSVTSPADTIASYSIKHKSGAATPNIDIEVTDKSALNGHNYEIYFAVRDSDQTKFASIKDVTDNSIAVENHPLQDDYSTPVFDGLRVKISDVTAAVDMKRSGFSRKALNNYFSSPDIPEILPTKFKRLEQDWFIVFSDLDTLADGSWKTPMDTSIISKDIVAPFKIYSTMPGRILPADFNVFENYAPTRKNHRWDLKESIILMPSTPTITEIYYQIKFDFDSINKPHAGDTLYIYTKRPVTASDIFSFVASTDYTSVETNEVVNDYELFQNFPNPFNPGTSIRFSLPNAGRVTLTIYNILGEIAAELINENLTSGVHTINWNAGNLASGIYIYRLQCTPADGSNSYMMSRKMVLIK